MIWVAIMAAIGIGGGFAGLIWGWRESHKDGRRARRVGSWWAFRLIFTQCPCAECERKRRVRAAQAFNEQIRRMKDALRAQAAATMQAIDALRGFHDAQNRQPRRGGR